MIVRLLSAAVTACAWAFLACLIAAVAHAETSVTRGTWDGYSGSRIVVDDAESEAACASALAMRGPGNYACRTITRVTVTADVPPAPADADNDGVPDSADECPTVNASTPDGCPATPQVTNLPIVCTDAAAVGKPMSSCTLGAPPDPEPPVTGSATLSWTPPTQNTDDSAAVLTGYRIHYGQSPQALSQSIDLLNPALRSFVVESLAPGTYYFAVRALAAYGDSSPSNILSKTIP